MAHQPAHWPHDEDDPPVGVSIRPLPQLPDLPAPAPTLPAGAPGASWDRGGSFGTPGASAMAHYQQARAGEWTRFARTLTWRRGARGERRSARALRKLARAGWTVLHDVAVPGSRANGDHLLIGPPGVFLIDSKAWHGHITQAVDGSAWHNGHPLDQTIATVRWEAQQLAQAIGAPVLPMLCVHDTRIPWDEVYVDNVPVLTRGRLLALLRTLPAHMDQDGVMLLAEHARHQLHPAT